jgi:hypothetical protein
VPNNREEARAAVYFHTSSLAEANSYPIKKRDLIIRYYAGSIIKDKGEEPTL